MENKSPLQGRTGYKSEALYLSEITQLNTLDLKGEQKTEMTAKVLQMAADSVTLETLKSLLVSDKSKQTANEGQERSHRLMKFVPSRQIWL